MDSKRGRKCYTLAMPVDIVPTKRDPEFMRKIGKKGGQTTKKNHGLKHFKKAGKKGGHSTRKMWEERKK